MEVVASGMAVASLSIQLIQSIDAIQTFITNFKDAPKELQRLTGLLERLNSILQDVHNITEQQTSLNNQHFPLPSTTIFHCLQGCEQSLLPLQAEVESYKQYQTPKNSRVAAMKGNFKMSWRAKEIAGFEVAIQREIDFLQAALAVNSHTISMSMYPVLLQNQQKLMKMLTQPASTPTVSRVPQDVTPHSDHEASMHRQTSYTSQKTVYTSSALRLLGVTRRKVVRYLNYQQNDTAPGTSTRKQDILSEMNELCWVSTLLGWGLTWTCRSSYGTIAPSISVYPIVSDIFGTFSGLMNEDIGVIQHKISSGTIHPYVRLADGFSLLHLAALSHRSDICQLLIDCSVPLDHSTSALSPFEYTLSDMPSYRTQTIIDTWECLIDNFEPVHRSWIELQDFESFNWLWRQTENRLFGEDALKFQRTLVCSVCMSLSMGYLIMTVEEFMTAFGSTRIKQDIISDIEAGNCLLLLYMLEMDEQSSAESYLAGKKVLDFLTRIGVDIETWVSNELGKFQDNIFKIGQGSAIRVIFERDNEGSWKLGFEWALNEGEPGFLVCSEYDEMACSIFWDGPSWPFEEGLDDWGEPHEPPNARFNRRMASKARKERKRAGLKIPKSRMPGSWS